MLGVDGQLMESPLLHKDDAPCHDARLSFASPVKKSNSSKRSPMLIPRHRLELFAAASSSTVPSSAVQPMTRLPRNLLAIPTRLASGEHALLSSGLRAWSTCLVAALRGLFPPEDRHKVVVLATTKPADRGLPMSHWSLDDLAIQILKDAHYRDMSRSTIQRILNSNDLKPHRCTQWLHSEDPDFETKALDIAKLYLDAPRLYQQGELLLCTDEKTSIQAL